MKTNPTNIKEPLAGTVANNVDRDTIITEKPLKNEIDLDWPSKKINPISYIFSSTDHGTVDEVFGHPVSSVPILARLLLASSPSTYFTKDQITNALKDGDDLVRTAIASRYNLFFTEEQVDIAIDDGYFDVRYAIINNPNIKLTAAQITKGLTDKLSLIRLSTIVKYGESLTKNQIDLCLGDESKMIIEELLTRCNLNEEQRNRLLSNRRGFQI